MKPFSVLFGSNDEITYKGKTIKKFHMLSDLGEYRLKFSQIQCSSHYIQAIVLFFNDFSGEVYLNEVKQSIPKSKFSKINIWADTAPDTFCIRINLSKGNVAICNGSDPIGDRVICHTLNFGCAIHIEQIAEKKYRFSCNDHENDDDFNDLIFTLEVEYKV